VKHSDPDETVETRDPGELEEWSALEGWELKYLQLGRGPFGARFNSAGLGASALQWERWDRATHLYGTIRDDVVPFGLVVHAAGGGYFQGSSYESGDVLFMRSGSECDLVAADGHELFAFHVPRTELDRACAGLGLEGGADVEGGEPVTRPSASVRASLFRCFSQSFDEHQHARTREERESSALFMLLSTLHPRERGRHAAGTSARQRLRYAKRAHDFIEEHFESCVRLEDIAQAAGVGARTLQLCFREKFGFGPMEYLRLRRLHEARRVLQRGSPDSVTVTDAALICGFAHLGRFSRYYQSTFGELPSRTLSGS
jgi:AraC-like DNA-binding protein